MSKVKMSAEELAQKFHETYERLAPNYNYETRKETAVPWENVPDNNKQLMIAVSLEILADLKNKLSMDAVEILHRKYVKTPEDAHALIQEREIVALEVQLVVARKVLEEIRDTETRDGWSRKIAREALAEMNKVK